VSYAKGNKRRPKAAAYAGQNREYRPSMSKGGVGG